MRIPEVRAELLAVADKLEMESIEPEDAAERIRELEQELYRRTGKIKKTKPKSTPMTPALAREIRKYKKDHPKASIQDIGIKFKVNNARVSESLIGKRE